MPENKIDFCWKKFTKKSTLITLEICIATTLFCISLSGIFLWRLSQAPIDLARIKPFVQEQLSDTETGYKVEMQKLSLFWPGGANPLLLRIHDGTIKNKNSETIISLKQASLGLSFRHLLVGQVKPTKLIIQSPSFTATKKQDGSYDFGFAAPSKSKQPKAREEEQAVLQKLLYDISQANPEHPTAISELEKLEILEASLTLKDENQQTLKSIPDLSLALNINKTSPFQHALGFKPSKHLTLAIEAKLDQNPEHAPQLALVTSKQSEQNQWDFAFKINNLRPSDLDQIIDADIINQTLPEGLTAQLDLRGAVNPEEKTAHIENSNLLLGDVALILTADLKPASNQTFALSAAVTAPEIKQTQFEPIWPLNLKENVGAHEWLTQKLSQGTFQNISAQTDVTFTKDQSGTWQTKLQKLQADFDFSAMDINYRSPMTPVENAQGSGHFDYHSEMLTLNVTSGTVGENLKLENAIVELAHIIEGRKGQLDINLNLAGPARDMFAFIEGEPLKVPHGFDKDKIGGTGALNINIGLPVRNHIKMEDIKVKIRGKASDLTLPSIIKQTALTGANAAIILEGNQLDISGSGNVNAQPINFDYTTFIDSAAAPYRERVIINGTLTEKLRNHFGIDLSEIMSGPAPIKATYTKSKDKTQTVTATADLTPATLYVRPLGYEKQAGQTGKATLIAHLQDNNIQTISALNVTAPDLNIQNSTLSFSGNGTHLAEVKLPQISMEENQGSATLTFAPNNKKLTINAAMQQLDIRPLLSQKQQGDEKPGQQKLEIFAEAQKLLTNKKEHVTKAKFYAHLHETGRFDQLEFDANTASADTIYLRYKPNENGIPTFHLEADNAGATLRAFGLYENIKGGQIKIHGQTPEAGNATNIAGTAELTNFTVTDAPILAKLLSLMSLEGLASGMTNDGIEFARLETRFDWQYQPGGSLIIFEGGRTSGAAIGLSFEGSVNNKTQNIKLNGTLVPLSGINKVLGSIPLIGNILTGGSGLIAATYKVDGKTDNPDISINPLSVLAPGILRRILFE